MDIEKMTQIKKELEESFDLLRTIPVMEENVEKMAMAKEHLRKAYKLAESGAKEDNADGGQDNG